MYAGTGEGFYNTDGIRGAGVFTSTDGGTTWTQLPSTANASWFYVNKLAMSPDGAIDPGRDANRPVPLHRRRGIVDEHAGRRK